MKYKEYKTLHQIIDKILKDEELTEEIVEAIYKAIKTRKLML